MTLLDIKFGVVDFFDVICLTQRHDQFEHSNYSKDPFLRKMFFSLMHIDKRLCIIFPLELPSPW